MRMSILNAEYGSFLRLSNVMRALVVTLVTALLLDGRLCRAADPPAGFWRQPHRRLRPAARCRLSGPAGEGPQGQGLNVTVINAGVSGDTTAAALSRLDWALADKPTHAIVELGANDMLRGLPPEQARANLDAILAKLKQAGIPVLLTGMQAAPNLGADYGRRFNSIYPDLAARYGLPLYPFFLDGVAAEPKLNLGDGMHPNREGVSVIVDRILPQILRFLGA